jgi:hypothetical protein
MPTPAYNIQQLDSTNYPLLVPLMKDCFHMDVTPGYFKWKYFDNPAGPCVGFLALEKETGMAVSFYGAIPQRYLAGSHEIIIYQACDTMTHTGHRKKSLYPILARECFNYLKNKNCFRVFGIGGVKESFPVLAYFGFKTIGHFKSYFKPRLFCFFSRWKNFPPQRFMMEDSPESIRELIAQMPGSDKLHSPKDPHHYAWRLQNPNHSYMILHYKENDSNRGYIVYLVQNDKIFLLDFFFTGAASRKALFWNLSRLVLKKKYKGILALCQEQGWQSRELKKSNFMVNPFRKGPLSDRPPLTILGEDQFMEQFADPSKWALTAYDYDAI